ncbi:hypothetical protein GC170_12500 [bacterium]|nr:hypothetical protein [bacterium]
MNTSNAIDRREDWISVSTRKIRRPGDPEWDDYIRFLGLPHLQEVRTIDSWCNPCHDGNYFAHSVEEALDLIDEGIVRKLRSPDEYHLAFVDAQGPHAGIEHPRFRLLGHDLSDETWTSSLLNCGYWMDPLDAIARRTMPNGLLNFEDALQAKALLPEAWNGDPHAFVTIWALYEILDGETSED